MKVDKNEIEKELREVEKTLEGIGRKICSVKGGQFTWYDINRSLEDLREGIRDTWMIED